MMDIKSTQEFNFKNQQTLQTYIISQVLQVAIKVELRKEKNHSLFIWPLDEYFS